MKYWLIGLGIVAVLFGYWYYRHQQALALLPPREVLIQAVLEKKLKTYKDLLVNKCQEKALEEAKEIADSIAFAKADALMLFDSIPRPEKPLKPIKPELLPLKDSLEIKPLLLDSFEVGG